MQLPLLFRSLVLPLSKSVRDLSGFTMYLPVFLSLGGMLGQQGPWRGTLYIGHLFLLVARETATN